MGKIILYIAVSLDGLIADEKGGVEWLDEYQIPDEDYGYKDFLKTLGAVIMGSKTYEQILTFNHWYEDVEGYVFTSRNLPVIEGESISFINGEPGPLIEKLRLLEKDSWLVGGGNLITRFINEGLLDELILTIIPKVLGKGIPLFAGIIQRNKLELTKHKIYPNSVVQLSYKF